MVKIVFVCYRLPQLTSQEFQNYWRGEHAQLVREVQETVRIRRYVQSRALDVTLNAEFAGTRGMSADALPDGIAEAWYDTVDDLRIGFQGPEGERAAQRLAEDEAKFVDHRRSFAFMTQETEVASSAVYENRPAAPAAGLRMRS